jgi:hypothetical protein
MIFMVQARMSRGRLLDVFEDADIAGTHGH